MKINFDDEQEGENTESHMKIPSTDQIYKEQLKIEQLQKLKSSLRTNKLLLIFIILFCSLFTAYQIFQDYRISSYRKEILELKDELEEMKNKIDLNRKNVCNV